jgi:heme-degrading monooxygenase HmoA
MSLTVLFELPVKDGAADAEQIISQTLAQTADFPGNEGVEILVDDVDPSRIVCILRWADSAAYDAYIAWRQTPAGAHRLFEIVEGAPITRRFSTGVPITR